MIRTILLLLIMILCSQVHAWEKLGRLSVSAKIDSVRLYEDEFQLIEEWDGNGEFTNIRYFDVESLEETENYFIEGFDRVSWGWATSNDTIFIPHFPYGSVYIEEFVNGVSSSSDTLLEKLVPFHIDGSQGRYYLSIYYETGTNIITYDKLDKSLAVRNLDSFDENGERVPFFGTSVGYTYARDTIAFASQGYGEVYYYSIVQDTILFGGFAFDDPFAWCYAIAENDGRWFFGSDEGDISYSDNISDPGSYRRIAGAVGSSFVVRLKVVGNKIFALTYDSDDNISYLYSSADNGGTWQYEAESTSEFMDIFLNEGDYYWVGKTGFVFKESTNSVEEDMRPELRVFTRGETLNINSDRPIGEYLIYDMNGRIVLSGQEKVKNTVIDIRGLSMGSYIIDLGYSSEEFVKW